MMLKKSAFKNAVIVNKKLIYFVIGDGDIKNPQLNPKPFFRSSIEDKVRKTRFETQFGILITTNLNRF